MSIMSKSLEQLYKIDEQLSNNDLLWLGHLEETCPEFLGERYSNPYYATIPKGWFDARTRILIVGEEGHGTWGMGKGNIAGNYIGLLHQYNWEILGSNLYPDDVDQYELFLDAGYVGKINSAFWNRARQLTRYGVCAWTNQDRIHVLGKTKCALTDEERDRLHSVPVRLLHKEIELLDPTHVFFFGFYRRSVQHELPEVFDLLQPGGYEDKSRWFKNVVDIPYEGRHYIFSYHPAWRGKPQGYEERVMDVFRSSLA